MLSSVNSVALFTMAARSPRTTPAARRGLDGRDGSRTDLPSPPRQPMRLKSAPKYGHSGNHRVVPPRETCRRARLVMEHIGVTRLADVTGLDHVGIPVWAAVR